MVPDDLPRRIDAVKRLLAERRRRMNPCLSEGGVSAFELRWGVRLPEDYRLFLLQVGNGGVGPPSQGLERLGEVPAGYSIAAADVLADLNTPFPLTEPWYEDEPVGHPGSGDEPIGGVLVLGDEGCGHYWWLVVTGADRGHVWQAASHYVIPCTPPMTFLDWYEKWLRPGM